MRTLLLAVALLVGCGPELEIKQAPPVALPAPPRNDPPDAGPPAGPDELCLTRCPLGATCYVREGVCYITR